MRTRLNIHCNEKTGLSLVNIFGLLSSLHISYIACYWSLRFCIVHMSSLSTDVTKQIISILRNISWPDINYYRLTVTVLFLLGALSDERTGLSFVYAAGPGENSFSRVRVSRQYFTVPDLRLLFSSPPTTRRVTVEVFDYASTPLIYTPSCLQDNSSAHIT
jgi:hypothetical protein